LQEALWASPLRVFILKKAARIGGAIFVTLWHREINQFRWTQMTPDEFFAPLSDIVGKPYCGEGAIFRGNEEQAKCTFIAAQFLNGGILCVSSVTSGPRHFQGESYEVRGILNDGRSFEAIESIVTVRSFFSSHSGPVYATYFRSLRISSPTERSIQNWQFGIVNFEFVGTAPIDDDDGFVLGLPVVLKFNDLRIELTIVPKGDREEVLERRLPTRVTAEIIFSATESKIETIEKVADRLCHVMSIARGTLVQWIYRRGVDENGLEISVDHHARFTKPRCPLAAIDPRAGARFETGPFVEIGFRHFLKYEQTFELNEGTIAAYLDAKAEGDYLEMRGSKAAIALEMLKAAFLDNCSPADEYCIPTADFQGETARILNRGIKSILKQLGVLKSLREKMADVAKLQGLNRHSFASILRKMCHYVNLTVDADEIRLLVKCRNSLVHRGRFYCQTATAVERRACSPKDDMFAEYMFLINFLDRFFLKLMGHSGAYCNWRGDKLHLP
jgi:hypothetical protein